MGRRKIEIQPLGDERTKTVTFVKRKAGLFKKAYELSVLCEVDMAVIIVGSDRVYEFSSVDTKELMNYYSRQRPVESKSPEDYGEYKRRSTLKSGSFSSSVVGSKPRVSVDMQDKDLNDGNESEFESVSPEPKPKRHKRPASPSSIYAAQPPPVHQQFMQRPQSQSRASQPETQVQSQSQRPVLRVQIPSEAKSSGESVPTVTPTESNMGKQENRTNSACSNPHNSHNQNSHQQQPPSLNAARFSFNGKFRSPESRKQMPQLHVPMSKSQSSSPSSAAMPQLPVNGAGFMSSLPPPSPSGQYPPSILPTPIFHQVFNQQYMTHMNGVPGSQPSPQVSSLGQIPSADISGMNGMANGPGDSDAAKFKPRIPQQVFTPQNQHMQSGQHMQPTHSTQSTQGYINGEQTPGSGLPSRYMAEIFPSPSNLYPPQEWPTGLTPYSATMSHYFAGMPPSANGQVPPSGNLAFAAARAPLSAAANGQRPAPARTLSVSHGASGPPLDEASGAQQSPSTSSQPNVEFMGSYFKKDGGG